MAGLGGNKVKRLVLLGVAAVLFVVFSITVVAGGGEALKAIFAKALTDHECSLLEWGFTITQVPEDCVPGYIYVAWADGSTETVPLSKYTGKTAHYVTTSHLESSVVGASTYICASWSGQFNLSHGPCSPGEPTPTPTLAPSPTPTPPQKPSPTPTVPVGPSPTPTQDPCADGRVDLVAFFLKADPRRVTLNVGGTNLPPRDTAVDAFGRIVANETLWPDKDGWRVKWQVPPGFRLLKVETRDGAPVATGEDGSFYIQRCTEYRAYYEYVPDPTATPEPGPPPEGGIPPAPVVPTTGLVVLPLIGAGFLALRRFRRH